MKQSSLSFVLFDLFFDSPIKSRLIRDLSSREVSFNLCVDSFP